MAEESNKVLMHAVRGRVVVKYSGQLALLLAVLTLVPLAVAIFEGDVVLMLRYLLLCGGLFLFGGYFARLPAPEIIQGNEALTVTALAFLVPSFLMAWPIMTAHVNYLDALFEAVSGVTTTGLSTLGTVESRQASFQFLRSWMQWYGGLGFVVLSVALLMGHQAASRRLISPVESGESMMATARTHARRSLIVYCCLTLAGLALVWPLTGDGFTAMVHVLSSVSTGGFSSFDNSLEGMHSRAAAMAIIAISFFSAISLPLYWQFFHAGVKQGLRILLLDVELRAMLLACLLAGAALSWLAWLHDYPSPWYHGFMQAVSAQTTVGFATRSLADLDAGSKLIMIMSMLVGGSVGSSAGGFKMLRLLVLLRVLQLMLRRPAMPPHAVAQLYLSGQPLAADDINRVLQLVLLFIFLVFVSWAPFVVLGYDPLNALFEVASACGTVGLSSGITRPELEGVLKGILCFDMLAGRVEIIALLIILYPRNWFGRREVIA